MDALTVTRTETYGNLFLPGLVDRHSELGELHAAAMRRGEATTGVEGPLKPGGWNLTAPLEYFDQLEAIATATIGGNTAALRVYRGY